jgi:hypothetical protein
MQTIRPNTRITIPVLDHCSTSTPLLLNEGTGQLMYGFCNRRRICRRCANIYRWRIRARFGQRVWKTMLTVTMPPSRGDVISANIDYMAKAWTSLCARLRRRYGAFDYAGVREGLRPAQRLHAHILLTISARRLDKMTIATLAEKAGFGSVLELTTVHSQPKLVSYVVKDLRRTDTDVGDQWPRGKNTYFTNLPPLKRSPSQKWRLYSST